MDDEESIRHVLSSLLEMKDCEIRLAGSAEEAIDVAKEWEPDIALLDIVLPGMSGIKLLSRIKQIQLIGTLSRRGFAGPGQSHIPF